MTPGSFFNGVSHDLAAYWTLRWCDGVLQKQIAKESQTNTGKVNAAIRDFIVRYHPAFYGTWNLPYADERKALGKEAILRFKKSREKPEYPPEPRYPDIPMAPERIKHYQGDGSEIPLSQSSQWAFRWCCGEDPETMDGDTDLITAAVRHFVSLYLPISPRSRYLVYNKVILPSHGEALRGLAKVCIQAFLDEWAALAVRQKARSVHLGDLEIEQLKAIANEPTIEETRAAIEAEMEAFSG